MIRPNSGILLPPKADFCKKLEYLMLRYGYSAERLGERIGVHPRSIYRWRHGQSKPCIRCLTKIAQFFKVSVDWLMKKEKI